MYNILIISNNRTHFTDLMHCFKKDFFNVFIKPVDYINHHQSELHDYDFILFELEERESKNHALISHIKYVSKCPLYLFGKGYSIEQKIRHFEFGAEGFVDIPFVASEACARIKSVLRYLNTFRRTPLNLVRAGNLTIRLDNREVSKHGKIIQLTNVEFKILKFLLEHKDQVVSKDQVIHAVWDDENSATDNALGIHITRLRKKINDESGAQLIETIWGLGYRLNHKQFDHFNADFKLAEE